MTSCREREKQTENKTTEQKTVSQTPNIKTTLVDYKSETYKISLGDNYKTNEKIIDWNWAALDDEDGKIDSKGKDAFLFLGEPLIKYNDGEWLPSLHIETDKNIITKFTCSVLFDLADSSQKETKLFLNILSKDIKQLQNRNIINALAEKGIYKKQSKEYFETFKLTKAREFENSKFEYTIELK